MSINESLERDHSKESYKIILKYNKADKKTRYTLRLEISVSYKFREILENISWGFTDYCSKPSVNNRVTIS